MSTVLAARYHQGESQTTVMEENEKERRQRKYMSDELNLQQDIFATVQGKPAKQIVNQNFGKLVNNRTRVYNATKINQYPQASTQVR